MSEKHVNEHDHGRNEHLAFRMCSLRLRTRTLKNAFKPIGGFAKCSFRFFEFGMSGFRIPIFYIPISRLLAKHNLKKKKLVLHVFYFLFSVVRNSKLEVSMFAFLRAHLCHVFTFIAVCIFRLIHLSLRSVIPKRAFFLFFFKDLPRGGGGD